MATTAQPAQIVIESGPDLIVVGVLLLSVFVALFSIATQRIIAKKRAAYDYMVRVKGDINYAKDQAVFNDLKDNDQLETIINAKTEQSKNQKQAVRNYLNYFELLCVSIEMHIVDENVCKAQLGDILVKRWEDVEILVSKIRKQNDDSEILEYFEKVATRWKDNPRVVKENIFLRVFRELFTF